MKTCTVEGCGSTFLVRKGLCNKHSLRLRRHGDPLAGGTFVGETWSFLEALLGHEGDECVCWPFAKDANGYARIRSDGENIPAYRVMCRMAHGDPVEPRTHATHTCGKGNEGCVNPKHLEWGTAFKNQQDRVEHGTSNRGERCAAHKLTAAQALEIFQRLNSGERPYLLAPEYAVSPATVRDIKFGLSWSWLTGVPNPKARDIDGNLIAANDNVPAEQRRAA